MKRLRISIEGKTYEVDVEITGEEAEIANRPSPVRSAPVRGASVASAAPATAAPESPAASSAPGDVPSPLAGNIISVDVEVGQNVAAGDKLITMEAMKMNTIVNAPIGGAVSAIYVQKGEAVEEGKPLLAIT